MNTRLSIIVPTLNEASNLPTLAQQIHKNLAAYNWPYELLIVDDRSEDDTCSVARELSSSFPIRLIERTGARDLSAAVCEGMDSAIGEILIVMDADLSHPPEKIVALAVEIHSQRADLVIGSRYTAGGSVDTAWPWRRRLMSRLATLPALWITQVKDPMSGFFAVSTTGYRMARQHILPIGFKIGLELLATPCALRVVEVPIHFANRQSGSSKLTWKTTWSYMQQLARHFGRRVHGMPCRLHQKQGHISRHTRAGFTLLEVLVSIAVICLLIAIIVPAVNAAREAARRTQCTNKLRNIAVAVVNFHSAHRHYPQSRFEVPDDVGPDGKSWSWMAKILPYMEHNLAHVDANVLESKLGDTRIIMQSLEVFVCPSDSESESRARFGSGHFEKQLMGTTNYKANMGANWGADETQDQEDIGSAFRNASRSGEYDGQAHGDGIMWRNDVTYRMSEKKVKDGLSRTFLIGEDVPKYNQWNSWAYNNNAFGTCAIALNYNQADPYWWPDSMGFRSEHRGGVMFANCDASVVFISADTAESLLVDRATRWNSK